MSFSDKSRASTPLLPDTSIAAQSLSRLTGGNNSVFEATTTASTNSLHKTRTQTSISTGLFSYAKDGKDHQSAAVNCDAIWLDLSLRILPLFSGEGLRGCVEDMNDTLRFAHWQKTRNQRLIDYIERS
jgi:hypothetical protein